MKERQPCLSFSVWEFDEQHISSRRSQLRSLVPRSLRETPRRSKKMEDPVTTLTEILGDYRRHDGFQITSDHIIRWSSQFPEDDRPVLLRELAYTYGKTYISRSTAEQFVGALMTNPKLAGSEPDKFWRNINILGIQRGGSSQRDLLDILDAQLNSNFGFGKSSNDSSDVHLYLDDGIYSGNRVHFDFQPWLENHKGKRGDVHVVVLAQHTHGQYYAAQKIQEYQRQFGTQFKFHWWRCVELEDRRSCMNRSDVLRPTELPQTPGAIAYAKRLSDQGYPVQFRAVLNPPYQSEYFSGEAGRQALERIFLEVGARTLAMCPNFSERIRPYGFNILRTLGFGSLIATYRNCPNTAPVALWANDPWHPLLPRKTN